MPSFIGEIVASLSQEAEIIRPVSWTLLEHALLTGSLLARNNNGADWTAGASSIQNVTSGDCVGVFQIIRGYNLTFVAGLGYANVGTNYTDIDFGFYYTNLNVYVFEAGSNRGLVKTFSSVQEAYEAIFKVEVISGTVTYYINETAEYVSLLTPSSPLYMDVSIYHGQIVLGQFELNNEAVVWENVVNCAYSNGIYKPYVLTYPAWEAGGYSNEFLLEGIDGFIDYTINLTYPNVFIGLNWQHTGYMWDDIQYAFYFTNTLSMYVYELGSLKYTGTYTFGDTFKIATESNVIKYYKNDSLLYTSLVSPVFPLVVDTSIAGTTHVITRVGISNGYSELGYAQIGDLEIPIDNESIYYLKLKYIGDLENQIFLESVINILFSLISELNAELTLETVSLAKNFLFEHISELSKLLSLDTTYIGKNFLFSFDGDLEKLLELVSLSILDVGFAEVIELISELCLNFNSNSNVTTNINEESLLNMSTSLESIVTQEMTGESKIDLEVV